MFKNTLKNKNCFLTGATGGLGREIAFKLSQMECNLFLTDKDNKQLEELQGELESINKNNKIFYHACDLNNHDEINILINNSREKLGSINILINSAGIFPVRSLIDCEKKDFELCFNVNVIAPFLFCKEFSKDMIKNCWGRIVNIGSSSAYNGSKDTAIYCASKHALLGLSRSMHEELKEYNIRTFFVAPAGMKTEMGRKIKKQNFETFIDPKEVAEFIIFIILFNANMISQELRLNRMIMK